MCTKHKDIHGRISAVHNVLFREWAQRVSDLWKWQESRDRKLSSCPKSRKRKLVLGEIHGQVLIGSPAKAIKLTFDIDGVNEKLFYPISLRIRSKICDLNATSRSGSALWDGFGGLELHYIGSLEKYKVELRNFWNCFETSIKMTNQWNYYDQALLYCKSRSKNACSCPQHH